MKCNTKCSLSVPAFFCLFFVCFFASVWTLITHNPPSRLTLSFNCIHTSCSVPPVFSHLSPQMFLLDCQKAADLTYRGRNKATGWFLTLFFSFFSSFKSSIHVELFSTNTGKEFDELASHFDLLFHLLFISSSHPQGLFWAFCQK